jgi:hypothetical protein
MLFNAAAALAVVTSDSELPATMHELAVIGILAPLSLMIVIVDWAQRKDDWRYVLAMNCAGIGPLASRRWEGSSVSS